MVTIQSFIISISGSGECEMIFFSIVSNMVTKSKVIKVVGYCRVSDKKQEEEGHSIDAQKQLITDYCIKKGYKLIKIYSEQITGSSKCLERAEFKKLIADLENGKASGLIVTKFDRISRNLKDMVCIIDDYFKNKFIIHFIDFDHVDLNTPEGMFQLNLFSSFAQLERSMIAKRTKSVLDFKKTKNEKLGGFIPWGYKVIEVTENNKIIKKLEKNEDEIKLLKELNDLKTNGKSFKELSDELNDRNIKNRNDGQFTPSLIFKMLRQSADFFK